MKKMLLLSILLPLLFVSCDLAGSDKDKDDSSPDGVLTKFDISNAKSLMIRPRGASSSMRSSTTTNEFVKINADGTVVEVTTVDQNGDPMTTTFNPTALYPINETYIAIVGTDISDYQTRMYLIRLSDGAVYEVPSGYYVYRLMNDFKNSPAIQYDDFGNLYWPDGMSSIIKVDCSNPANLTAQKIIDGTAQGITSIYGFVVNGSGHLLYWYYNSSIAANGVRVRKSNGGYSNIAAEWLSGYWVGNNGNIKYASSTYFYEIAIDASYNVSTTQVEAVGVLLSSPYNSYRLRLSDETYIISISGGSGDIFRVESDTAAIGTVSKDPLSTIGLAAASSSYLYLSGNNASGEPLLMRMDPVTETPTVLLAAGLYDVLSLVVSADDEVTFNALRMADGKKVMGTIDAAGTVTIVDESADAEVVSLIQVN